MMSKILLTFLLSLNFAFAFPASSIMHALKNISRSVGTQVDSAPLRSAILRVPGIENAQADVLADAMANAAKRVVYVNDDQFETAMIAALRSELNLDSSINIGVLTRPVNARNTDAYFRTLIAIERACNGNSCSAGAANDAGTRIDLTRISATFRASLESVLDDSLVRNGLDNVSYEQIAEALKANFRRKKRAVKGILPDSVADDAVKAIEDNLNNNLRNIADADKINYLGAVHVVMEAAGRGSRGQYGQSRAALRELITEIYSLNGAAAAGKADSLLNTGLHKLLVDLGSAEEFTTFAYLIRQGSEAASSGNAEDKVAAIRRIIQENAERNGKTELYSEVSASNSRRAAFCGYF